MATKSVRDLLKDENGKKTSSGVSSIRDLYTTKEDLQPFYETVQNKINAWFEKSNEYFTSANDFYKGFDDSDYNLGKTKSNEWNSKASTDGAWLGQEAEGINKILDEYSKYFDTEWISQVRLAMNDVLKSRDSVSKSATNNADFWNSWDDIAKGTGKTAEEAYTHNYYTNKYNGYSYKDIQKAAEEIRSGGGSTKELSWLVDNADYFMSAEEAQAEIDSIKKENPHYFEKPMLAKVNDFVQDAIQNIIGTPQDDEDWAKDRIATLTTIKNNAIRKDELNTMLEGAKNDPSYNDFVKQGESKGLGMENEWFKIEDGEFTIFDRGYSDDIVASRNGKAVEMGSKSYFFAQYMTDDEYKNYVYFLGKYGEETANDYLDHIEYDVNSRQAGDIAKWFDGTYVLPHVFGLYAGLDQFGSGIEGLFSDGYKAPSAIQMASGLVRDEVAENEGDVGTTLYDFTTTMGNMAPSILASTIISTAIGPEGFALMGATTAGKVGGAIGTFGVMGPSAAGNARQEMLNLGYSEAQANTYGALTGISEASLQYILGGINKLGGGFTDDVIKKVANGFNNAGAKWAIQFGAEMASEALEESLQEVLDPFFKSFATGQKFEGIDWGQVAYSGLLGALSAGVLKGMGEVGTRASEFSIAKGIKGNESKVNALKEIAGKQSVSNLAQKLATKIDTKTGAWKIADLIHEMNGTLSEQNVADIKYQLMREGVVEADAQTIAEYLGKAVDGDFLTAKQRKALDTNPTISRVFKKVVIDQNSTVNQRLNALMDIYGNEGHAGMNIEGLYKLNKENNIDPSKTSELLADMYSNKRKVRESARATIEESYNTYENKKLAPKVLENAKISESGKTTDSATGKEVSIKKIKDAKSKMLELSDGSTISSKDIAFATDNEAILYEMVLERGYDTDTANAVISGLKAAEGLSVMRYLNGVDEAIEYGKYGYPMDKISNDGFYADLSDSMKTFAYNLGKDIAKKETASAQARVDKSKGKVIQTRSGNVIIDEDIKDMTSRQETSITTLGKVVADITHSNVYIYESVEEIRDGKKVRVFAKDIGKDIKAGMIADNGFYDKSTGDIYIDLHAGTMAEGTILWTAAHELTHFIHQWSPAKFKVLADFLVAEYGKQGESISALIDEKIASLSRPLSRDLAYEEVVADAMQMMFTDANAIEKVEKLKNTDKKLWEKIKDFFADLFKKITEEYKALGSQTKEAELVLKMSKETIERLSNLFAEALVDAGDTYGNVDIQAVASGEVDIDGNANSPMFSFRNSKNGMANDALVPYNEKQTEFIKQRGDYIIDSFEKLKEIVNLAFDEPDVKAIAHFGMVDVATLQKIKNSIPNLPESMAMLFTDNRDYSIATTLDSIRHIVKEKKLTRQDVIDYLDRFADTIVEFDEVDFHYYTRRGIQIPGLLFRKDFADGKYISYDLVSQEKQSLLLQSLYLDGVDYNKKRKSAEPLLMHHSAPASTSKTRGGQTSDNRIAQDSNSVNSLEKISFSERNTDSIGNTLSKEQMEFFKDSKVRDKDGNLLVVRHGTDADFHIFDFDKAGKNGTAEGYGFYFSDDPEITNRYGATQKEVYLNITKPLYKNKRTISRAELTKLTNALIDFNVEKYKDEGLTWQDSFLSNYVMTYDMSRTAAVREFVNSIWETNDNDQDLAFEIAVADGRAYEGRTMKEFYNVLTESIGYDGIIAEWSHEGGTSNVYVTFNSEQSKYTTNTNPTTNPDLRFSERASLNAEQQKHFDYNQKQTTVGSTLKTLKGSTIKRSTKYGVGKEIGGEIYFHKNYAEDIMPSEVLSQAERLLEENHPGFEYNCLKYNPKTGVVAFQEAPDFDTAREPIVGDYVSVNTNTGETKTGHSNYIWHHKWNWVKNDYNGFDVEESWEWSKKWLSTLTEVSDGNGIGRWENQLDRFNLPHDGMMFSERKQEFDSKDTSIKILPATFTKFGLKPTDRVLDWGGGQYDIAKKSVEHGYPGIKFEVVDAFNRTPTHNERVLKEYAENPATVLTINNVLNVIKETDIIEDVIKESKQYLAEGGVCYIKIHEGSAPDAKTGVGKETSSGWQNNQPAEWYKQFAEKYYRYVERSGDILIASDSPIDKKNLSKTSSETADAMRNKVREIAKTETSQRDVLYSERGSTIYIKDGHTEDGGTVDFVNLILDGKKKGETRTHKNLTRKWVGIAKDGKVYGRVRFGEPYLIDKNSPEYKDSYIKGTEYDLKDGETKYYYPILETEDFRDNPKPIEKPGNYGTYSYSERILMGSLFSGGGTLEAGLVYKMLDKEFAVEYKSQLATVYTDNHGKEHMFVGDVRDFDSKGKRNVFYLHASPSCPNYSPASNKGGETEVDIITAEATARILEEQMPQAFTVENVRRYIGSEAYNIIANKLTELGYKWDVDVYKASDYGNATKRERMIIRAVKDGELPAKPAKVANTTSWGEATRDLWETDLIPSNLVKSKIEAIRNTPQLKNLRLTKLDKPLMIYDTNKRKQVSYAWVDELAPTLTTKCGDARIIMPDGRVYKPTPKFMGRIQGLPDNYKYPKATTNAFKIIGNGIPTQLTKAVIGGVLDSAYEQTHNGDILYSERNKAYLDLAKDPVKNEARLREMVDEAAKKAGYPERLYHGTQRFGFTKTDTTYSDDGLSFFATSDIDTAKTYSSQDGVRNIAEKYTSKEDIDRLEELYDEKANNFIDVVKKVWGEKDYRRYGDHYFSYFVTDIERGDLTYDGVDVALNDYVEGTIGRLYKNRPWYKKNLKLEAFRKSDEVQKVYEASSDLSHTLKKMARHYEGNRGNYQLYANTEGLLVIDGKGANWNRIESDILPDITSEEFKKYGYNGHRDRWTTRSISKYASDNGYRGVLFKDIYDDGGKSNTKVSKPADVYSFFYPQEQVKSADLITYDDNGNIIPLEERFNKENDSLLYSERNPNAIDNRTLLANALESVAQTDVEKSWLAKYKAQIADLNEKQNKLAEIRAEIKNIRFTKGADRSKLTKLENQANILAEQINKADKKLLQIEASKALKGVVDRERAKAYKLAADKGREVARERREGRQKTELRAKIKNFKQKMQSMLFNPTDNQYVPQGLAEAIIEVCTLINTDTSLYKKDGSINKAQEQRNLEKAKLDALLVEYAKLKKHEDPMYAGEFDETVYAYLEDLQNNLKGRHLSELSLDELSEAYDYLRAIDETLRDARKLIGWGDADLVYDIGDAIAEEQASITNKRKNGKRNAVGKAVDLVDRYSLSPMRNVERMSDFNEDSKFYKLFRMLEKGVRKKNRFKMESVKLFDELSTGKNAKTYEDAIYKAVEGITLTDIKGQSFGVSKMQMMQAILSLDRENANGLNHIHNGGFTFADLKMLNKGKVKEAVSDENAHRIQFAADIVESFREALKNDKWAQAYMAVAREFFDGKAKDAVNETSLAMKHRIIAKDKNYIPFEVDRNQITQEISAGNDVQQTINSYGMLKSTTDGAPQSIYITGLNNILDRHIDQVATLYGLGVEVRNFNKVWNVKTENSVSGDNSVKGIIDSNWGAEGKTYIEEIVQNIQSPRKSTTKRWYSKLRSNLIGATFALNLSVVTKQIGSLYASTSMLNYRTPVQMFGNLIYTMANYKEIAAEVDKYTASAWMRRQGLSDGELQTLLTEGKQTILGKTLNKLPTAINPTKWIEGMDSAVALSLWKYAKADVAKKNPNLKGEELMKATAEFYDDVVEYTQSMADELHRPEVQKEGGIVTDAFGLFKTDLYQMSGQLLVSAGRYKANPTKDNAKTIVRTVGSIAMNIAWNAMMTSLFALVRYKVDHYRDDDDEELTAESWLKRQAWSVGGDIAGYILPLFGSEAIGLIERYATGQAGDDVIDNLVLNAINEWCDDAMSLAGKLKDDKAVEANDLISLLTKSLNALGVPANNVARIVNAIRLHAKDIANGEFLSFEAGVERTPKNLIHRVMEAIEDGDTEKAMNLYEEAITELALRGAEDGEYGDEELNEAKSKLKTALGSKYKNGEVSLETATEILSTIFGMTETDIYWQIDQWDYAKDNGNSDGYDKYDDLFSAMEDGDPSSAIEWHIEKKLDAYVEEARAEAEANGKSFNEARVRRESKSNAESAVKSAITAHYKKLYKEAYKNNDTEEMKRIRYMLKATKLYGTTSDLLNTCKGWLKD